MGRGFPSVFTCSTDKLPTQIYTHLSKKSEMEAYEKARKRK